MSLFSVGLTSDTIGKILLGVTVLSVHWHVLKEHKTDKDVLRTMRGEQVLGALAILLIVVGYVLQLLGYE